MTTLRHFRELDGCVIGYEWDGECRVVASGSARAPRSPCVAVIIEEVAAGPDTSAELADLAGSTPEVSGNHAQPALITNGSRIGPELIGAGVSCSLTYSQFRSKDGILGALIATRAERMRKPLHQAEVG
jgi:hypothetical protein